MFREVVKGTMNPNHFGIGSVISCDVGTWLVVGSSCYSTIRALNLDTLELTDAAIQVEDSTYLTAAECRKLVDGLTTTHTFTDFLLDPIGLKPIKGIDLSKIPNLACTQVEDFKPYTASVNIPDTRKGFLGHILLHPSGEAMWVSGRIYAVEDFLDNCTIAIKVYVKERVLIKGSLSQSGTKSSRFTDLMHVAIEDLEEAEPVVVEGAIVAYKTKTSTMYNKYFRTDDGFVMKKEE